MWIRSQNKKILVDTNKIYIECDFLDYDCNHKTYFIKGDCILGQYSTEEKALKVIDMMQIQISSRSESFEIVRPVLKSDPFEPYYKKREVVFQMPKDEGVK